MRRREHHDAPGPPAGRLAGDGLRAAAPSAGIRAADIAAHARASLHLAGAHRAPDRGAAQEHPRRRARHRRAAGRARRRCPAERERADNEALLRARITQLWQTRMLRYAKLTVADEIENALSYYQITFLREIPRLYREHRGSAARPRRSRRFFRMGNWIGGDRDGNPFVTAETLRHRARAAGRDGAALLPDRGARARRRAVDVGDAGAASRRACRRWPTRSPDRSEHREDEPYRRALIGMYARLAATLRALTGTEALRHAVAPQNALSRRADEFLADLRTIERLAAPPITAQALIAPRLRAADARGRRCSASTSPPSTCGRAPTSTRRWSPSCCARRASSPTTRALDEAGAARRCCCGCSTTRGRCACASATYSELAAERARHLRGRARAARALRRARRIRHYIISHTEAVSDLLEVLLLQKEAGLMRGTLRRRRRRSGGRPDRLAAVRDHRRPARRRADHARVLRPARHRRDAGARARAAPSRTSCSATATATRTAASSPATGSCTAPRSRWWSCSTSCARARRHAAPVPRPRRHRRPRRRPELPGDPGAAAGHGERADPPHRAGRGDRVASTPTPRSAGATSRRWSPPRWRRRCSAAARRKARAARPSSTRPTSCRAASMAAYRELVYETPGFADYFFAATPIREIAELNIGSRPASRKATRAIEDLRAIPWSFSWGQCRVALPGWYGFGSAVEAFLGSRAGEREERLALLQRMYRQWPFFRTLLSNLDMVLAKSDLAHRRALRRAGARTRRSASASSRAIEAEWQRTQRRAVAHHRRERAAGVEPVAGALDRAPLPLPRPAEPPAGRADAALPRAPRGRGGDRACSAASTSRSTASPPGCATPAEAAPRAGTARRPRPPTARPRLDSSR